MYQNDTFAGKVYGIPCGEDGTPDVTADWRTIVQLDAETEGAPDGMAIDAAGNLWVAHEQGGQVSPGHLPAVAVQPEPGVATPLQHASDCQSCTLGPGSPEHGSFKSTAASARFKFWRPNSVLQ